MTDNWDDEDEWDVDDDALDAKLGIKKDNDDGGDGPANNFDDEEDLALKEKAAQDRAENIELKKKGSALAAKKKAEEEQKENEEIARRILEEETVMMSKLSIDEQKEYERKREMENDIGLLDDSPGGRDGPTSKAGQQAGDAVALKDMKDHLKHARKVAEALKAHGNIHWAALFIKETLEQSKDVLDDDAITDIIKVCNVIKNEKVQAAKRKVKGQAQKSKKADKAEKAKAKKLQDELFGDNNEYDVYDEIGESYEDSFF